jgi:hypothetical protein
VTPADQSGKRPAISEEQRARVQAIVDEACLELDRETVRVLRVALARHKAQQRRERYLRIALWVLSIAVLVAFVARMSTWRAA